MQILSPWNSLWTVILLQEMEVFVSPALLAVLVLIQLIDSLTVWICEVSYFHSFQKNLLIKFVMWQEVDGEVASLCNPNDQTWQWRGVCVVECLHFIARATGISVFLWEQLSGSRPPVKSEQWQDEWTVTPSADGRTCYEEEVRPQ